MRDATGSESSFSVERSDPEPGRAELRLSGRLALRDAPEALRLAASSIAQAVIVQQSAFARLVESGGPLTSKGRSRRAFTVWLAATDRLVAGYGMLTLEMGKSLELIAGARVEHSSVEVRSRSTAGEPSLATPSYTDVLPSLALNYHLGQNTNFRLSATQTLSRPEYRELAGAAPVCCGMERA